MIYKLNEIASVTKLAGFEFTKYMEYIPDGEIIAIRALNLKNGALVLNDVRRIAISVSENLERSKLYKYDIVLSYTGTIGECAQITENDKYHLAPNVCKITPNSEIVDPDFLFQYIRSSLFKQLMLNYCHGSTQPTIPMATIRELPFDIPFKISEQRKVAEILKSFDRKIEVNSKINENLEQQAQAIFKSYFAETANSKRKVCRADEYFEISIGKTPPRKEPQWFTECDSDIIWVSISDMGNCGIYIDDSSEYLTKEAVDKFNIKIVPNNTVILSFKLTVGRVAITSCELTTNEAIAHFKSNNKAINEYLYCYLKQFDYQSLGSTSSIAVAVNSKIIKGMPFVIPTDKELIDFHRTVYPMFEEIKKNQQENKSLSALRDTLLPKLMNGEIDVSKVKI